jgi:hypothetical protein
MKSLKFIFGTDEALNLEQKNPHTDLAVDETQDKLKPPKPSCLIHVSYCRLQSSWS